MLLKLVQFKLTETPSASLKHVCPEGIYVTITHGDASLWSGVLFVRRGTAFWEHRPDHGQLTSQRQRAIFPSCSPLSNLISIPIPACATANHVLV